MKPNPWRQPCPTCHRPVCGWHSPGLLCDGDALTPPPPPPRPVVEPEPNLRPYLVAASLLTALGFLALWSLL